MTILETMQIHSAHNIRTELQSKLYSVVSSTEWELTPELVSAWETLRAEYVDLPPDEFLPGNARYRFRRFDSFYFDPVRDELLLMPHRDYFQSTDINTVTGGIVRRFEPLTPSIASNPFLLELIRFDFLQFPLPHYVQDSRWQVDVHLIRVVAQPGQVGQPSPEGIHRDGAEYVTVHLAERDNVVGGEVSIYDDNKEFITSFTPQNVLDSYLFRDKYLWHAASPISPVSGDFGVRSILTFDYHYVPDLERPR